MGVSPRCAPILTTHAQFLFQLTATSFVLKRKFYPLI